MTTCYNHIRFALALSFFIVLIGAPFPAQSEDLYTAAQDSYPKYIQKNDGSLDGLCGRIVDAIKKAEPTLNIISNAQVMPFPRIQDELKNGRIDLFVGMAKSEERQYHYIYSEPPVYSVRYVLISRIEDFPKLTSEDALVGSGDIVIGMRGSKILNHYKSRGINVDESHNIEFGLKKLMEKRGRYLVYHDLGIVGTARKMGILHKIKPIVIYPESPQYLAFSREVTMSTLRKAEKALKKLTEDGTLQKIKHQFYDDSFLIDHAASIHASPSKFSFIAY